MEKEKVKKEVNKKRIIVISIITLIIITAIATVLIFIENDKSYEIEEITKFSYFKLYENEKYGVIDDKGNTIIEAKYEMVEIPNPSKPVFICYSDYNSETEEYKTEVYNENKEQILTEYAQVLPLAFKDGSTEVPYEKSILAYKENEKYGIIDFKGKKVTDAIYDEIESILYKEGCLLVKINDKYGVINMKGKKIIDVAYDSISVDGYYDEETKYKNAGFIIGAKTQEGYRYGYIDNNGNMILKVEHNEIHRVTEIDCKEGIYLLAVRNGQAGIYNNNKEIVDYNYTEIEYNQLDELFIVERNSKQGVIDKKGNKVLPVEYEYLSILGEDINAEKDGILYKFDKQGNERKTQDNNTIYNVENSEYKIIMNEENKFGLIDKNSSTILRNVYSYIEHAYNNYFILNKDENASVIDAKANEEIISNYKIIQKVSGKNIIETIMPDSYTIELYNENMEKVASMQDAILEVKENYVELYSETERRYFDNNGNEIQSKDIFNTNLYAFNQEGKWGFKNKEGNVVVSPIYDMVTEINTYGFAGIKQNGKWGVIDDKGKIIVEPSYKIESNNPNFIGKYCQQDLGYGMMYYMEIK